MSTTASSTTKHTPTPWRESQRSDAIVVDAMPDEYQHPETVKHYGGYVVAESLSDEDRAFVLRAVNSYDQLVAALREIVKSLADSDEEGLIEHTETMMNARAALAAAEAA